jgi:hypothetical protein
VSATLAAGEDELTRARRVWQRRFGSQLTVRQMLSSALGKCASWPGEDFLVRPFGAC